MLRNYWVKCSITQTGAEKPGETVIYTDEEDENGDDASGNKTDVDGRTRRRLREARLNTMKNALGKMN